MSDDTVELFEVIMPIKGTAILRKWDIPRKDLKQDRFEKTCEDGCLHFFSVDIMETGKRGAAHDQKRMLRKMRGEHSDEEEENEKENEEEKD